ncbi:MAG TPA: hypothetical protein VG838_08400 [Opitutaceae bacterium]|nr:hypothetical protein [Opitutaceae bacterium]
MNEAFHIFGKDIRRLWPIIVLSMTIHIIGYCIALSNIDPTSLGVFNSELQGLFQMAPLARWLIVFLLSVWVIHEDRAIGDRAAWLTRPISGGQILIAKVAFIVAAVSVPAGLASVSVALWLKAPLLLALAAGTQTLIVTFETALGFAVIAVVCSSTNQAGLILAGVFASIVLFTYCLFDIGRLKLPLSPFAVSGATYFLVACVLSTAVQAAALGHQYATLRTIRTIIMAAALISVANVGIRYWPINLWPYARRAALAPTLAEQLHAEPISSLANFVERHSTFSPAEVTISIPLRLGGASPDRVFWVNSVTSGLTMDDGRTVSTVTQPQGRQPQFDNEQGMLSVLGFRPSSAPITRDVDVATVRVSEFERIRGQKGRLTTQLQLIEGHYSLISRLPTRLGAEAKVDGHLCSIQAVLFSNGHCELHIQFVQLTSLIVDPNQLRAPFPSYVLINEARKEFSSSQLMGRSGNGRPGMTFATDRMAFASTYNLDTFALAGKVDAEWLSHAELCVFRIESVDSPTLNLSITSDPFVVPTKQLTQQVIIINPDGTKTTLER